MNLKVEGKIAKQLSKDMIGLFFEDINFAADGGLYAEMIENSNFESKEAFGTPANFYTVDDFGYAWSAYEGGSGKEPILKFVSGRPLSEVNPHYLKFTAGASGQGFKNKAYDGIAMKKGTFYKVSFYARSVTYTGDALTVKIEKDGEVYAQSEVAIRKPLPYLPFCDVKIEMELDWPAIAEDVKKIKAMDDGKQARENDWFCYETILTAKKDVRGADFIIAVNGTGILDFDMISMIPEDAVEGVFRKDLYEALEGIKPRFIRFPGGCIVEGISLPNRYQWKNTVGPLKDRKTIPNLWAFMDDRTVKNPEAQAVEPHYGQTYGIGFYEYFVLCERLGAKALPVLGVAGACQFRSTEIVDMDDPVFMEYVQDALDLIEFANGDINTKWGALRAKMGHPEPFHMEMLAIGNEQWETKYFNFYDRYVKFQEIISAQYPDIKLLGSAGPWVYAPIADDAWKFYRDLDVQKKGACYAVDEHYYVSPEWLYENVAFYDNYPRDIAVFAGEYAAHTAERENTMEAALAEAAFLTGVEKNGDVVRLASYAPLFNRIGHSQWKPDLIWFDDADVYLTPSYYVQKIFGNYAGDVSLELDGQIEKLRESGIYVSAVKTEEGKTFLKVVNTQETEVPFTVEADTESAVIRTLVSAGERPEGKPEPTQILEKEILLSECVLPARSFSVIEY